MKELLITIFTLGSIGSFSLFLKKKFSPLWLMFSAWFLAIAISQLHLSNLELPWPVQYWFLIGVSLISFALGYFVFKAWIYFQDPGSSPGWLFRMGINSRKLRIFIYFLFLLSLVSLFLFYSKAGNFPLFSPDPDEFRFQADLEVPGLINYSAQLARLFIPLSFFLIFNQRFSSKKHWDLVLMALVGTLSLILFTSRTQIFFIDLWVMALYLLMRKPNWKRALKFYPAFLLVSVLVLSAVPLYRQYKSYGAGYLGAVTGIKTGDNMIEKAILPIYVGVSFNQQALLHAENYYKTHALQHGKVSLDPFTNLFGKVFPGLNKFKSHFDLGEIFYSWWNTGTYLFPFVQDFGTSAFYFVPFIIAGILTLVWKYWQAIPNYLSINLYAYAIFFIVMTVYLSFTVRAEMFIDLFLLLISYLIVSRKVRADETS